LLEVPDLPLIERAKEWGISVKSLPGNYFFHGSYSKAQKKISLATDEEGVFFHELAHAGHEKVNGDLKKGQDPFAVREQINLNRLYLTRPLYSVLSTLLHEMVHSWEFTYVPEDKRTKSWDHSKAFRDRAQRSLNHRQILTPDRTP